MLNVTTAIEPPDWARAQALAMHHSPFLRHLIEQSTLNLGKMEAEGAGPQLARSLATLRAAPRAKLTSDAVMAQLRQAKADVALLTALADLSGAWSLGQVTHTLSDFADLAIDLSLAHALQAKLLGKKLKSKSPMTCLALGKLGGHELNYSSDVDLIFFYDEMAIADDEDASEQLSRVVHAASRILQEPTQDGYVFRVDLRLRPDPGATPPALSMAAAEVYYQSAALNWERAAFTRARACAGNIASGQEFLSRLSGWIWRRNLDFSAMRDIDALRDRILDHYDLNDFSAAGYDVKRGIGGIREIEFLMQIFQLIHGGRRPELRTANTPQGLSLLAGADIIPHKDAIALTSHYSWLRMVEHRLQMQDDQQVHSLPIKNSERTDIALFCGASSLDQFESILTEHVHAVHEIYERLLGKKNVAITPKILPKIANSDAIFTRWDAGRYRALAHPRARSALEKIKPALLNYFSQAADPAAALARWDTVLAQLPAGISFLEMFEANPNLLGLIAKILTLSESMGTQLAEQPHLLDVVLEQGFFAPLSENLNFPDRKDVDGEARLHRLSRWVAEQKFRQAVHILSAVSTPLQAAHAQTKTMDSAANIILEMASVELTPRYGRVKNAELVVLGLGAWGGGTLGPDSDLDAVFIFTGTEAKQSDGMQKISSTHYFNKLGQRFISLMTSATPSGRLAEIDMRLRPSGAKGLLVVSTEGFRDYQEKEAWVWEHMALTRARCISGDRKIITSLVGDILKIQRDANKVRSDVLAMRMDMDQYREPQGELDMKLAPGGLVDIEFMIQYLQLSSAVKCPEIMTPDLLEAIHACVTAKLLDPVDGQALVEIWTMHFSVRTVLKLCAEGDATVAVPKVVGQVLFELTGQNSFAKMMFKISQQRKNIMRIWQKIFDQPRM
jgi:[glutamine synthetase] adenylyltransferase / [glutamine synthetase]-adenylyl-L-tyrosine phosphorylase